MVKKKDYLGRTYYRIDSIFESLKFLFFSFFIKSKLYTHKPFLYKMPSASVIKYNFLGRILFNLYNIILFFFLSHKIKFLIEDNKLDKNDLKDHLTNPTPIMIKKYYLIKKI